MGTLIIAKKEFRDFLSSRHFWAVYFIFTLIILASAYQGAHTYNQKVEKYEEELRKAEETPQALYRMDGPEPSILSAFRRLPHYIALVGSILAIMVGFDAVSRERDRGTLQVLLSYPTYRDAVINGKFLGRAGALILACTFTLILGIGVAIGLTNPPLGSVEIARIASFMLVAGLYLSAFLLIAMLLSVVFRDSISSMATGIILWSASVYLLTPISKVIATLVYPIPRSMSLTGLSEAKKQAVKENVMNHYALVDKISTASPSYSFQKLGNYILNPHAKGLTIRFPSQGEPLPLTESLNMAWPSIAIILGLTVAVFVASYILFMRQDVK